MQERETCDLEQVDEKILEFEQAQKVGGMECDDCTPKILGILESVIVDHDLSNQSGCNALHFYVNQA
jgi:hypothetical protein